MAPSSSLAALLHSPAASSNDSTIIANGKTLPDITLGSLGSSFRSDDQDGHPNGDIRRGRGGVSRAPNLPSIQSPETSNSASISTPSPPHMPASALLSLSPPTTVRRSSSQYILPEQAPGSHAPRRSRILRKSSMSSASSSDVDGPLEARYGGTDDDDDGALSVLPFNVNPGRMANGFPSSKAPYHGGPRRHGGRHSVAADISGTGPFTLRDQEQQLNAAKKDIFNLQLENHFLKERLTKMAPDHIEAALKENVKLKLEILNLSKEMTKLKKLLLQQDRDLAETQRDREGARGGKDAREIEAIYREEKERRKAAEAERKRLQMELDNLRNGEREAPDVEELRAQLEETEAAEAVWRRKAEQLEEELETARATAEDQAEEMNQVRNAADQAQEDVERLQSEAEAKLGLSDSIGISKGREARLLAKLEQDNATLLSELEALRKAGSGNTDELEDRLNELRDRLAAAQLNVDHRDQEIEQLNEELDGKVRDHDKEILQVEADWRDEFLEARTQVDELKDVLEGREQDIKEIREVLTEREEELAAATNRVAVLEAAQGETHDQLEETMQNIDRDNADKEADLVAANREVEELGQRVLELEEGIETFRIRERDLNADLRSADEAFENAKTHYENLVNALKEARRKLQDERDGALVDAKLAQEKRVVDKDAWRKENLDEAEKHRRILADKDQVCRSHVGGNKDNPIQINARLQTELEAARDRVAQRDRDLLSVQTALRSLETERRKLGVEHTSDRFSLELEMERVKRDLAAAEDELDRARGEVDAREETLRQRDLERAQLLDKLRDLEARLASERQGRLNLSDKLDIANKNSRQLERDAESLRQRIEELEPLLTETQQERFQIQRQSEQQRQERSELLVRVFKDVNRFLGTDGHATPANFAVFRDTLLQRLRSMNQVRSDFEKRVKETEASVEQRMVALKKQLEQKWRTLDNFEASVKKLETTRMQWRNKYSTKDGELEAAKVRNTELSHQLAGAKAGSSTSDTSSLRSLTERAQAAGNGAQNSTKQLALLEQKLAELQAKNGQAENKWEARVKEYENRLRIAGEKIKTEKQGGKERARELEGQVRELERQVDLARQRNRRVEGVVATAAHLLPPADGMM